MKNFFTLALIFSVLSFSCFAQNSTKASKPTYKTAIGIRFYPFAISLKSNIDLTKRSFEIDGYFKDGFVASFLYLWNFTVNTERNIKIYAGPGGQVGFLDNDKGAVVGVGGAIGVDYKFLHLPINISADWQPAWQFGKSDDFKSWGGLAVRFTL